MNKLYIFCGIPFSGKTTIAKKLVEKFGFVRIDLDDIKFSLFGPDIQDEQIDKAGWDRIYQKMYEQIEDNLRQGKTVINDTGNFTSHERSLVKKIADTLGIETTEVFIDTPAKIARQRWLENKKTGKRFNIRKKDFDSTIAELEPPTGENVLIYRYPGSIDDWIADNFQV
jgi:predicted kinase